MIREVRFSVWTENSIIAEQIVLFTREQIETSKIDLVRTASHNAIDRVLDKVKEKE